MLVCVQITARHTDIYNSAACTQVWNFRVHKIFVSEIFSYGTTPYEIKALQRVVTKTRNGLFHPVLFRILRLEAIQYLSLNPKNLNFGIPNPKSKLFVNNRKFTERSVPFRSIPFRVLVTALKIIVERKFWERTKGKLWYLVSTHKTYKYNFKCYFLKVKGNVPMPENVLVTQVGNCEHWVQGYAVHGDWACSFSLSIWSTLLQGEKIKWFTKSALARESQKRMCCTHLHKIYSPISWICSSIICGLSPKRNCRKKWKAKWHSWSKI